jgi:hypothetical protein
MQSMFRPLGYTSKSPTASSGRDQALFRSQHLQTPILGHGLARSRTQVTMRGPHIIMYTGLCWGLHDSLQWLSLVRLMLEPRCSQMHNTTTLGQTSTFMITLQGFRRALGYRLSSLPACSEVQLRISAARDL